MKISTVTDAMLVKVKCNQSDGDFCVCIFYSLLMTGVNTAIPSKFGLLTVLSKIRPPILGRRQHTVHEWNAW